LSKHALNHPAKLSTKSRKKPKSLQKSVGVKDALRAAIRVPKASEIVAGHIRKMILRGEIAENDYLMPEGQLLKSFGISRPTLREALRILETEHFITVSRGARTGARVHKPRSEVVARYVGFTLQAQGATLADIYIARMAIEPYAARILAEAGDAKRIKTLREEVASLYKLAESQDVATFNVALARAHRLIVVLAANLTLILIMDSIEEILERHQSRFTARRLGMEGEKRDSFVKMGLRSFEKLIKLIAAGDAAGTESHWRTHIQNANSHWLRGVDRTAILDILD
jgi:DNA-binding FadR family transcriptional regulator